MEHGRADYERAINDWVLGERNRKLLKRKYIDKITHEDLADEFDISPKTVQKTVNDWKDIIFRHL